MARHESFGALLEQFNGLKAEITHDLACGGTLSLDQRMLLRNIERGARREEQQVPVEVSAARDEMFNNMIAVRNAGGVLDDHANGILRKYLKTLQSSGNGMGSTEETHISRGNGISLNEAVSPVAEIQIEHLHGQKQKPWRDVGRPETVLSGQALLGALESHAECEVIGPESREAARRVAAMIRNTPSLAANRL